MIEQVYSRKIGIKHRKKYAQFFTPKTVAELMVEWVSQTSNLKTVLEPAFGLGIFTRLLLEKKQNLTIKGFDVDEVIFNEANSLFKEKNNIHLILEDYLFNDWNNKYDGILCNPPYFKFHDYENKKALQEIRHRLKINLNGFTNIYTLFLLKSIYQLNENGRAAYIIPSEFLNSDYGKYVKDYLIQSKALKHIIIFDFKEKVFGDALTTSAILFLEKDNKATSVSFTTIKSAKELEKVKKEFVKKEFAPSAIPLNELKSSIKWRAYYQKQQSKKYKHLIPFKKVAKVVRGIATGANQYFVFNQEKANDYQIPTDNLLPCITKSKDVQFPFFTTSTFETLKEKNANVFLFNAGKSPTASKVLDYIDLGIEKEINKRYLTSKRNPWFLLENRPPAPIWVSVFNRNKVKFIRNEAQISNLTTFHCIYLKNDLFNSIDIDLLFAYLQTDIAQEIFNDNRREYGDGLKKFEPNDLNNGLMLDLSLLTNAEKSKIKGLYLSYRQFALDEENSKAYLIAIEKILKNKYSVAG